MKRPAVAWLLWDKNIQVMSYFAARFPCTFLVAASNSLMRQAADALREFGSEVVVLEQLLTDGEVAELQRRADAGVELFTHQTGSEEWPAFCQENQFPPDIAPQVLDRLAPFLKEEMVLLEALHKAHAQYDIRLLTVTEEYTHLPRTAVAWAKGQGIPTLHVSHSMGLARLYTTHLKTETDLIALYGERGRASFIDIGIDPARLRVTGNPAWDEYSQADARRAACRADKIARYGLDPEAPIVMFGTTWVAYLTAYSNQAAGFEGSLRAFLMAGKALREAGRKINLVVKDRYSNAKFGDRATADLAASLGMGPGEVVYALDDAYDWVVGSDVVVACDSNLSIEAMLAGTPTINLLSEFGLLMGPSFEYESGVLEATPEDLAASLAEVLDNPALVAELKTRMAARAPYYNAGQDGSAARRVAGLMLDLCQAGSTTTRPGEEGKPLVPVSAPGVQGKDYVWQSLGERVGERDAHESYSAAPRQELLALFRQPPRRVLEIGCAGGATGQMLKQRFPDCWVAGIELAEADARIAATRLDVVIQEKFELCVPEDHGITPGSLDTVILADVLEHMYDPWGVLMRLAPYLTADAQVIASIPNARNLWLLNELAQGRFPYAAAGLLDITHIRFFTRTEIDKLFAQTGYRIEAWGRNLDPRLAHFVMGEGVNAVETEHLALKQLSQTDFEDLKTLQFLVRATPLVAVETGASGAGTQAQPEGTPAAELPPGHAALAALLERQPVAEKKLPGRGVRVAVYSLDMTFTACPQIRYFRAFRSRPDLQLIWAVSPTGVGTGWQADMDVEADVYVISRLFPGPDTVDMVDALFAKGRPVVYETDDLLIDLPADNMHALEYAPKKPYLEAVMKRAHALVVSTPELAMRLGRYNQNVHVLPNLVDFHLLRATPPDHGREVRLGILGTSTRGGDFALIHEALLRLCAELGKRLRLFFVGDMPAAWAKHPQAEHVPFLPDYGAYVARVRGLELDIGLAPLADNDFNACKSPLKWLEFSCLGMAGVYSHVPAYRALVEQGVTGLLVDNLPDKWVAAVKLLVEYPEKRLEIALAAQRQVLLEHSIEARGERVSSLYRRLVEQGVPAPSQSTTQLDSPQDAVGQAEIEAAYEQAEAVPQDQFYQLWQASHAPHVWDMGWMAARMQDWERAGIQPPLLHFGVICPAGREDALARNIQSLYAQYYKTWYLSIVSVAPPPAEIGELPQVGWHQAAPDQSLATLSRVLSEVPPAAKPEMVCWVGMMEAGDQLPPQATFRLAESLVRHPDWVLAYCDEDRLSSQGVRHTPYFKPDFNLDLIRAAPFSMSGLVWVQREQFNACGGLDPASEGVENWDLALRVLETGTGRVGHLAEILHHRDEAGGHARGDGATILATAQAVLATHLQRSGVPADIRPGLLPGCFEVRYPVSGQPLVSILLPSGRDLEALKTCLTALIEETGYGQCEILMWAEPSAPAEVVDYLASLKALDSDSLRILPGTQSGLVSASHVAVDAARGSYLLLFDPGLVVVHGDWLETLLGLVQQPGVAAVAPRHVNAESGVTHGGWILGLGGMSVGSVARGEAPEDPGYFGRLLLPHDYSALDTRCLLVARADFVALGSMPEGDVDPVLFSVALCQKLGALGRLVWTPHATLRDGRQFLPDSLSPEKPVQEAAYRKDAEAIEALVDQDPVSFAQDPAYNRNLSLMLPFRVEVTPALTLDPEWRPAPRILAIHADTMGCGEYRIIAPMRTLVGAGKVMGWDAGGYFHPREYARMDPDSIVMQRQLQWGQIELIQRFQRISKAFRVFELDDLITNIPIMSSQKRLFVEQKDVHKRFRKAVGLFDRFVVSTEYLAEAYKGYCNEIRVLPNYLEKARWGGLTPRRRGGAKARVGWAGSPTHAGDLRLIIDVVKATAQEVDWVFFGMCPDPVRHLVKEFHEPVKLKEYAIKLASLDLDLAIAPLEDIPFNHGKSHLRLLEYGVLGYPVICTDITPYRGDYPVTRVPNRFKDWVEAIRSHVAERDALARQGDLLRQHIDAHWMLDDHLDAWLQAWLP